MVVVYVEGKIAFSKIKAIPNSNYVLIKNMSSLLRLQLQVLSLITTLDNSHRLALMVLGLYLSALEFPQSSQFA